MEKDDDIAAFLPQPPQPAPAKRRAAIEAALRRFDGADEIPAAGRPGAARPIFGWPTPRRRFAGALLSAVLVLLIAGPIAWQVMWRPAPIENNRSQSAPAPAAQASRGTALADASPASPAAIPPSPSQPASNVPARETAPTSAADVANAPSAPAAPPPAPPPPPPPPPPAPPAQYAAADLPPAPAAKASAGGERAGTGSRVARMAPAAPAEPAPGFEAESSGIVVTGTRVRAANLRGVRRGDWNACTVDDPNRGLEECRRLLGRAARGAAGTDLAEGLDRAWQGDTEAAIAAFDRAIAAAPKSAFAYLNRGLAWRRNGDLERARGDLDRAVKYGPQEARNYYNRSLILRAQGAAARARHDEDRAVELDPAYEAIVP